MSTLVLHPNDPTTSFLKLVYQGHNYTIINDEISEFELSRQISLHKRLLFLGHGTADGLLGWGRKVFHSGMLSYINENANNVFIWCHADAFVESCGLKGFYTGMFISEVLEAEAYGIHTTEYDIDNSNELFAKRLREVICDNQAREICQHVKNNYTSADSPVIKFNNDRLFHADSSDHGRIGLNNPIKIKGQFLNIN